MRDESGVNLVQRSGFSLEDTVSGPRHFSVKQQAQVGTFYNVVASQRGRYVVAMLLLHLFSGCQGIYTRLSSYPVLETVVVG
jgi:hypothetical protein